jgi:hypothetical protein
MYLILGVIMKLTCSSTITARRCTMDVFELKQFFHGLLELSYNDLRPGWGNPCSHLLETMCIRQLPFIDKIRGDYTGDSHEFRLNNAGLKMYWEVRRYKGAKFDEFKVSIGGDQAKEYPFFVVQARDLIKKHGFNKYPLDRR